MRGSAKWIIMEHYWTELSVRFGIYKGLINSKHAPTYLPVPAYLQASQSSSFSQNINHESHRRERLRPGEA